MRHKKRVDLDSMGEGKDLGGVKSGGIIIRGKFFFSKRKNYFNKNISLIIYKKKMKIKFII